ncbi:MAG: transporter substrate-binding domain-containing protein [Methylobacteriaceae bacterium]|nr:transporter substrate-binding domain-containing protein [Methylobacteriaceae bacterium]
MSIPKVFTSALSGLVGLGLLAATTLEASAQSAPAPAAQGNLVDTIKRRGKLIVGMASFVPWAMRDSKNEWIGFEIDVAKKLAADMEVELELVPTAWDGIIPALISSRFDTIIGGLSITAARAMQVNFTIPYSQSGTGVVANKEKTAKMKWPADYNSADVTFTCRRGALPCRYIEATFPKATIRQFDDNAVMVQEVINGTAHASIGSEPLPTFSVLQNADKLHKPAEGYLATSTEGFAIRKGDPDALAFFNAWIAAHQANGWLKGRHDYWFKTRDWASRVGQ